ncbi:DUF7118 family protein [Natronosalvus vescus]|uniref:DUF7118 family protein n=1 Tax=Natronosalvus vescus TaxID=2953881 RepID=UPI002091B00F|nr:hypothetical protein [Natronosalvus vescus]
MSHAATDPATEDDPASRLERARERVDAIEREIDDAGGLETVETGAEAYRNATTLLENYVDRASGSGRETFKHYIQLEGQFSTLVEGLPAELPHRDAFEAAFDAIDKRRLTESDFDRAQGALEPAEAVADLLEERERAREELVAARKAVSDRLSDLDDEIDNHERLLTLADVDIDAPVERLHEPIDVYNEAIQESFETYLYDESARTVFDCLERSRWHPFVPFERPPAELREYVAETDAGEYPIPTLLEYADHSRSKLSHYVDDPDQLKRRVATRQTYLERIDATPLCLEWPPSDAVTLRYAIRDSRPLAERIGGQDVVDRLCEVRALTRDEDFDRLQVAATARDQLSATERQKLANGDVEADLESFRAERERLQAMLKDDSNA